MYIYGLESLQKELIQAIKNKEVLSFDGVGMRNNPTCNEFSVHQSRRMYRPRALYSKSIYNHYDESLGTGEDHIYFFVPVVQNDLVQLVELMVTIDFDIVHTNTLHVTKQSMKKVVHTFPLGAVDNYSIFTNSESKCEKEQLLIDKLYEKVNENFDGLICVFLEYYKDVYAPKQGLTFVEESLSKD